MSGATVSRAVYLKTFAALMVLLVLTIVAAYLPLGPLSLLTALTIAVVKALLIVLFFMHARYSHRLVWLAACAGFFWLFIMLALTLSDYASRGWGN
jgi:cytochrome c oxidase subunit IV